jgi:uncharacterized protein (TIGR02001 family)
MSQYVWRGWQLSDDAAIQPSVGIGYEGFGANIWSNYDTDTTAVTETDFTVNYAFGVDKFGIDVGYIFYTFPDSDLDTQEIYAAVSYDVLLSPALTVYVDFDEGEGAFVVGSISHSLPLPQDLALDLGASLSLNVDNMVMGTDSNGKEFTDFYNGELSASITIPVPGLEALSVTPKCAYSFPLSDDAEDVLEANALAVTGEDDGDVFYGGVSLALSF